MSAKKGSKKTDNEKEKYHCPWCGTLTESIFSFGKRSDDFWDNIDDAKISILKAFESRLDSRINQIKDRQAKRDETD